VELEIRPEPTAEERAAIVEAVRRALGEAARVRVDPWWQAGVRDEADEGSEAGGPLSGPPASQSGFG
jgi:hypothetical protein